MLDKNFTSKEALTNIINIQFSDVMILVKEAIIAMGQGKFTDIDRVPEFWSEDKVTRNINPLLLKLVKAAGPKTYGELIDHLKAIEKIFVEQVAILSLTAGMKNQDYLNKIEKGIKACDAIYGRTFFEADVIEDGYKKFNNFSMDDYRK